MQKKKYRFFLVWYNEAKDMFCAHRISSIYRITPVVLITE